MNTVFRPFDFSVYLSRKMLALLLLGFASGLPLALCTTTLQAWFSVKTKVGVTALATVPLVSLPYLIKFLWAPLLDRLALSFLDKRLSWVVMMQWVLSFLLGCMAMTTPNAHWLRLTGLAVLLAIFSATQDIAVNAYQTEILSEIERGPGISLSLLGYRMGMLVSGGFALILADQIGFQKMYQSMALTMFVLSVLTFFYPRLKTDGMVTSFQKAVIEPFRIFFSKTSAKAIILFIVLFKLGDAFVLSFSTPFLLLGLHFSLTQVGLLNKVVAMAGVLVGVSLAGVLLPMLGLRRAIWYFGWFQAITNLGFVCLSQFSADFNLAAAVIFIEEVAAGMATTALLAFMMGLCRKPYTATQFALLSASAAIARVLIGPLMGWSVDLLSWTGAFILAFLLALPALFLWRCARFGEDAVTISFSVEQQR